MSDGRDEEDLGPRLGCDLPLGEPGAIVHNELLVSGWAVSPAGIESVSVEVDDRLWLAGYGLDTPWVVEAMPEMPGAGRAGFLIRLDSSAWAPGRRTVTVSATGADGRRAEIRGEVEFRPFEPLRFTTEENLAALAEGRPAMWLERPRLADVAPELVGSVELSGWAHARAGIDSVLVTIGNRIHGSALRPLPRPDLLADYGADVAAEAGFILELGSAELPPGVHRVGVVALAADGSAIGVENHLSCRAEAAAGTSGAGGQDVDWAPDRRRPVRRPDQPPGPCREWEERALRAEAEAAASRTEANLAQMHQKGALKMLREAEDRLRDGDPDR